MYSQAIFLKPCSDDSLIEFDLLHGSELRRGHSMTNPMDLIGPSVVLIDFFFFDIVVLQVRSDASSLKTL